MIELGKLIGIIVVIVLVLTLVGIGVRFLTVSTDKAIIEQSKGYIDARNEKAGILILQYNNSNNEQRKFIISEVCEIYDNLGKKSSNTLLKFATLNCK